MKDCSWRASSQEGHRFIAQAGNRLWLKKKDASDMYKACEGTCRVYMNIYLSICQVVIVGINISIALLKRVSSLIQK